MSARRLAVICLALIGLVNVWSRPVHAANSFGTDLSDMWWIPAESGWGANIAHQREVVFLTLYVYGPDGRVKWYVATNMQSRGGASAFTFDGALYETTGPYFGGAFFNPAAVGVRQVGSATLVATTVNTASLTYSVDGVVVAKQIQRQTFRENNLTGNWGAAIRVTATGCTSNGSANGFGTFNINHNGSSFSAQLALNLSSCTISGTYTQSGRMGRVGGTINCTNGSSGTISIFEIEAGYVAFMARYTANYGGGCIENGTMAGLN
jgi:hypothetical protein